MGSEALQFTGTEASSHRYPIEYRPIVAVDSAPWLADFRGCNQRGKFICRKRPPFVFAVCTFDGDSCDSRSIPKKLMIRSTRERSNFTCAGVTLFAATAASHWSTCLAINMRSLSA